MTKKTEDKLQRTLPLNINAEKMLLGSILTNQDQLHKVNDFLRSDHFFEVLHQKIYQAFLVMMDKDLSITPITLQSMMEGEPAFKEAGAIDYINHIAGMAITVIDSADYGRVIYDLAIKRSLISLGEGVVNDAYNPSLEVDAMQQIEIAESSLYELASTGVRASNFINIGDSVGKSLEVIDRAIKSSDRVIGISSGLSDLDQKLSGFHNSDLVILAARPAMGKTAFAINFALNSFYALQKRYDGAEKIPATGFFSLEMSAEQLTTRLLSMITKIDSNKLRTGMVSEADYNKLQMAANKLREMPIFIDDTPALSISAIRTKARRLKRMHNLGILFVDYLQLIRASNTRESRVLEVSEITQGLKSIAKELNIPVVALSQLSRAVEQREDKRPILSDLRESGSIEQDADVVMFIHREQYYLANKQPSPGSEEYTQWQDQISKVHNMAEIIIAKHRNGPVGNVKLYYDTSHFHIGDLTPDKYQ